MLRAAQGSAQEILRRHQRGAAPWMPPTLAHLYRVSAGAPARVSVTRHLALTFRFVVGGASGVTVQGNAPGANLQGARTLLQRLLPRVDPVGATARGERQPRLRLGYVSRGGLDGASPGDARARAEQAAIGAARLRAQAAQASSAAARLGAQVAQARNETPRPQAEVARAGAETALLRAEGVDAAAEAVRLRAAVAQAEGETARLRNQVTQASNGLTRLGARVDSMGAEAARAGAGSESASRAVMARTRVRLGHLTPATPEPTVPGPGSARVRSEVAPLRAGVARTGAELARARTGPATASEVMRPLLALRAPRLSVAAPPGPSRRSPFGRAPRAFLSGEATAARRTPGALPPGEGRPLASPVALAHARPCLSYTS
ncbi:hypothetical protein D7W79_28645, partial [Corallococcus exercitus]|uniref:hypothetical protein n=1 Tax=Corallococcus exercitus TaxID=2316736 RepID=UPI000EC90013